MKNIRNTLNTTNIWKKLKTIDKFKTIDIQLNKISDFYKTNHDLFPTNTLFISFHKVGANNSGVLYSTNFSRTSTFSNKYINSLFGNTLSKNLYDNQNIYEIDNKGSIIFLTFKEEIIIFSSNKMLVEDAIKESSNSENLLTHPDFNIPYNTISQSANINLFINYNSLFELTNIFTKRITNIDDFSTWTATDIKVKNNVIIANGFGNLQNQTINYTDIFIKQTPTNPKIIEIIPENTFMLFGIGFDKATILFNKKNKLLQKQNNFWSWDKYRKLIIDSTNLNYYELINQLENEAGMFSTSNIKDIKSGIAHIPLPI